MPIISPKTPPPEEKIEKLITKDPIRRFCKDKQVKYTLEANKVFNRYNTCLNHQFSINSENKNKFS